MTEQKIRDYLESYRSNEREIQRLCEELSMWQSRAQRTTQLWNALPGGGPGEGFVGCVEQVDALQQTLSEHLAHSVAMHRAITRSIAGLADSRQRLILCMRYLDGFTWEKIAERMGKTYQWVCSQHKKSLKDFVIIDRI